MSRQTRSPECQLPDVLVDGIRIRLVRDAYGLQLFVRDHAAPCAILDVFEDRVQLVAFNQEYDEPQVRVKFGQAGDIRSIVVDEGFVDQEQ